ncbi:unnamed protein product [Lathyrus sativus]|nr:unnamed protein product [Lathyrus sativus]
MGRKRKLNIGSRMSKDSNLTSCQGSNAEETHPTSSHGQGINVEETHTTVSHAQGINAEETHPNSSHAQGSNAEETRPNPNHVEVGIHESEDSYSIPFDLEAEENLQINKVLNYI